MSAIAATQRKTTTESASSSGMTDMFVCLDFWIRRKRQIGGYPKFLGAVSARQTQIDIGYGKEFSRHSETQPLVLFIGATLVVARVYVK